MQSCQSVRIKIWKFLKTSRTRKVTFLRNFEISLVKLISYKKKCIFNPPETIIPQKSPTKDNELYSELAKTSEICKFHSHNYLH